MVKFMFRYIRCCPLDLVCCSLILYILLGVNLVTGAKCNFGFLDVSALRFLS